jgi:hypothetical protein
MQMVKLKTITPSSWLVLTDDNSDRVGLLTESRNQYILMIKSVKQYFKSKSDVVGFFKEDIFQNVESLPKVEKTVPVEESTFKGYPIKFSEVVEANIAGCNLPIFYKPGGSIPYAAGYYCLNFPAGHQPGFCVKLSSLTQHGYEGPFKTKKEMRAVLSKLRNKCK